MIETIYNFRKISPTIATGGQPDEHQLDDISEEGFEVVINLGLAGAEYSVPNERQLLESKGIQYIHIPVNFDTPEINKYYEFASLLKALSNKKIFIHCAANKRVSVFLTLFRIIEERMPFEKAMEDLKSIWEPNDIWVAYMKEIINNSEKAANHAIDN